MFIEKFKYGGKMSRRKSLNLISAVLLFMAVNMSFPALSRPQEITDIEGYVIDAETDEPVPGASVHIVETQRGVFTGEDGYFKLIGVPSARRLEIQVDMAGYERKSMFLSLQNRSRIVKIRLQPNLFQMDEIVVTATKSPIKAEVVTDVVKVIGREEIERSGASTVEQLFEKQPFLRIRKGNEGSLLSLRGFSSDYILFLVDGKRMVSREVTRPNLDRYSLEDIERIEILKGAKSALYGSEAVGGVVNIITRLPQKPASLQLHTRYAPVNGNKADARLEMKRGFWASSISAGVGKHRGDGKHDGKQMYGYDHDKYYVRGRVMRDAQPFRFSASAWYNTIERTPSYSDVQAEKTFNDTDKSVSIDSEYLISGNSSLTMEGQVLSAEHTLDIKDRLTKKTDRRADSNGTDIAAGANFSHHTHMWGFKHTVSIGGGYQRESFEDPLVQESKTFTNNVYRLILSDEMQKGNFLFSLAYSFENNEGYGYGHTPQFGVKWNASDNFSLRLNLKKGFLAPRMSQRFRIMTVSWHPYIIGRERVKKFKDDPLTPENAYGVECAFNYRKGAFILNFNPYYSYLKGKIAVKPEENVELVDGTILSNAAAYIYRNIDNQKSYGADIEASVQGQQLLGQIDRYRISMSYAFIRSFFSEDVLDEDPRHSLVLKLESGAKMASWLDMDASLTARGYDRRSEFGGSSGHASGSIGTQKDPYAIMDFMVSFVLFDRSPRFYMGINNIADFVDINSRIVPGREFFMGIRGNADF